MTEAELVAWCEERGVKVRTLSSYYHGPVPDQDRNCLVVNYSGLREEDMEKILPLG